MLRRQYELLLSDLHASICLTISCGPCIFDDSYLPIDCFRLRFLLQLPYVEIEGLVHCTLSYSTIFSPLELLKLDIFIASEHRVLPRKIAYYALLG
jgi:hypothetical protein